MCIPFHHGSMKIIQALPLKTMFKTLNLTPSRTLQNIAHTHSIPTFQYAREVDLMSPEQSDIPSVHDKSHVFVHACCDTAANCVHRASFTVIFLQLSLSHTHTHTHANKPCIDTSPLTWPHAIAEVWKHAEWLRLSLAKNIRGRVCRDVYPG